MYQAEIYFRKTLKSIPGYNIANTILITLSNIFLVDTYAIVEKYGNAFTHTQRERERERYKKKEFDNKFDF